MYYDSEVTIRGWLFCLPAGRTAVVVIAWTGDLARLGCITPRSLTDRAAIAIFRPQVASFRQGGPMPQSEGKEGCVADKIAKLAQLRDSGALTEKEFQRLKKACLGMPRGIFWLALAYLAVLLALFAMYITWPGFRSRLPMSLAQIPFGVVWFGATGAVMASLYGIFVHNRDWNTGYNYWHYCRPFFGAVTGSIGALMYLVLLHLGSAHTGGVDPLTFYVVAFVLGFADKSFMQLLQNVTTVIVKPGNQSVQGSQTTCSSAAPAAATCSGTKPGSGEPPAAAVNPPAAPTSSDAVPGT